jgi:hypothetical protein
MWGPTLVYAITAREEGGKCDDGTEPAGDYLGCTVTSRFVLDGEDWNRGNDYPDGPFNRATWDRIAKAIRCDAIRTLPEENEATWVWTTKATTRDLITAKMRLSFEPTLKGKLDAKRRKKAAAKKRPKAQKRVR